MTGSKATTILSACGRTVGPEEVQHAQVVAKMCIGLSRNELALTLCEHWDWVWPGGKPRVSACLKILERLEREGYLTLPTKRAYKKRRAEQSQQLCQAESEAPQGFPASVECDLKAVKPVGLELVEGREPSARWNKLMQRYHPQGYKRPFGCSLRYDIVSAQGPLGCVLVSSGARALRSRDDWIGWSAQQRLGNLSLVINNSRFLLFPWVHVPHLASHVLGLLARQIQQDWYMRWNYRPVLLETFVDPDKHRGVCYRAAGWQEIGETIGRGRQLRGYTYRTSRKLIFVRPLVRDFRTHLLRDVQPE